MPTARSAPPTTPMTMPEMAALERPSPLDEGEAVTLTVEAWMLYAVRVEARATDGVVSEVVAAVI